MTTPTEEDPAEGAADPWGCESLWRLVESAAGSRADDPLVGMTLGGVEIVRMVAEGGMGRVYEGRQTSPPRVVAVKVLRPGPIGRATIHRFLQEARILAQLHHPGICQVHTAGTFVFAGAELPYFVMEFVPDGLPITAYVRRHDLPLAMRLNLFADVCDAVGHAHARGVIHRDLKPGNVLVDATGRPRVIDFGIARDRAASADLPVMAMTGTGELLGTIQYMSPEQVAGGGGMIDARADVYALGMILHELVAGRPPYDLTGVPLLEAVRVIRDSRPALHGALGASGADVALVAARCLEKHPRQRYADAQALTAAVRRLRAEGPRLADRVQLILRRFRGPWAWRGWAAAGLAGCTAIFVASRGGDPSSSRPAVAVRHRLPTGPDVPSLAAATVPFRYSFTSALDEAADRHLVGAVNVVKWNDPREDLRVNYWGPTGNDAEGVLTYRFEFPGRTARIVLEAELSCWDFEKHPGGFGRGAAAVEASRDGSVWVTLQDDIRAGRWGVSGTAGGTLPAELLGSDELWLRIRLLTERAEPRLGYTVAQFARAVPGAGRTVFSIRADCVPRTPAE